jgi:hypothetical protein
MPKFTTSGAEVTNQESDYVGTSVRTSAALTASPVASSSIDVRGYRGIDFLINVTNKGTGPITRIDCTVEVSDQASPASTDWAPIQAESVAGGVATVNDYTIQKDISGLTATFTLVFRAPVTARFMRIKLSAGAGTPTSSAVSATAYRRI